MDSFARLSRWHGKTALTEKLLLFGGAIQLAGEVKARGERRGCARIGWRSSASAALGVLGGDELRASGARLTFNLLDTRTTRI
jgi:peptide chain release factor 3